MTDRELLEQAAKAAGIEFDFCRPDLGGCQIRKGLTSGWWNPLEDDADALRLAVKLKMSVLDIWTTANEKLGDDPYAATRRAIVRAAAEVGKSVK